MNAQSRAILAVQWQMLLNFYRRHGQVGFIFSMIVSLIWYSGFIALALFLAEYLAQSDLKEISQPRMATGFFFAFLYWQGMPLAMASMGGMLDIRKLKAFPVASGDLFRLELLLRTLLFAEMPIVMLGCMIGLLRNPSLPKWCALVPLLFAIFNISLGAGIKDLVLRLMGRKGIREFFVLAVVLIVALPSLLARRGMPKELEHLVDFIPLNFLPWVAAGQAALATRGGAPWAVLLVFVISAWFFGRWQFDRSLNFDSDAARSGENRETRSKFEFFFTWPNRIFPDPLAALIEKEIRFLSRVSRFRTVFLMGFSFGLIIWLPMVTRGSTGWMSQNFLVAVSGYSLLLLSGVCFYNCFGFDRSAAQSYFVLPVQHSVVLLAKNITTIFFVIAEITLVVLACILFQMPVTAPKVLEAICVCIVMTLFLLGLGNITSTQSPRSMNPNDSWKNGSAKAGWAALFVYPLIMLPVGLAYLARWAFRSDAAFFIAIGCGVFLAASFYWVSLSTAAETMEKKREEMLTLLSQTDAPVL